MKKDPTIKNDTVYIYNAGTTIILPQTIDGKEIEVVNLSDGEINIHRKN